MTRDQIKVLIEEHVSSWSDDDFAMHGIHGVDEAADAIFAALSEASTVSGNKENTE